MASYFIAFLQSHLGRDIIQAHRLWPDMTNVLLDISSLKPGALTGMRKRCLEQRKSWS